MKKTKLMTPVAIYALAAAALLIMMAAFALILPVPGNLLTFRSICKDAGDVALILAPFWLLKPRWRPAVMVPVVLVAGFLLMNIWYLRFWGDMLPMSSLLLLGNVDSLLLNSIRGLTARSDLWIAVPAIAMVAATAACWRRLASAPPFPQQVKVVAVGASVLLFAATQVVRTRSMQAWMAESNPTFPATFRNVTALRLNHVLMNPSKAYLQNGLTAHLGMMLHAGIDGRNVHHPLTAGERRDIERFIGNRTALPVAANAGKNVIFIIVESLNADVVGDSVGLHPVTPVLDSLLRAEGTFRSTDMATQIREGGSSDGQLLYNTGLMPTEHGVTAITLTPFTEFRTLRQQLGRPHAAAVFADNGSSWGQTVCYRKYGFDEIHTENDFAAEAKARGADAAMFDHALTVIDSLPQPFFLELVTISMHVPFDDKGVSGFEWARADAGRADGDYLRMTAYFDHSLGRFIDGLRQRDLMQNTLLILASDHSQQTTADNGLGSGYDSRPIVFLAANAGVTAEAARPVAQTDVYPTILDLAGVSGNEFRGVGVSMLDTVVPTPAYRTQARRISELILRGNYWADGGAAEQ